MRQDWKLGRLLSMAGAWLLLLIASVAYAADPPKMLVPSSFDVSATGAFTYHIPIDVPPGTAGMKPDLALDYSSQNASDGLVGWGWTISGLTSVTRCPKTFDQDGVHGGINFDSNDKFCMEGQRLVPITQFGASNLCTSGTEYRTEIEGWSRIASCGGSVAHGPDYFIVWSKSGQKLELGNTTDSKILAVGITPATVRVWAVDKIWDTINNYISFTYTNDATHGQAYPYRIYYTLNDGNITSYMNFVQFNFVDRKAWYIVPTYQAGSLIETTKYLNDIATYTNGGSTLVYDYKLTYSYSTTDPTTTVATQPSPNFAPMLLTSVSLCTSSCSGLPPTSFGWQTANLGAVVEDSVPLAQGLTVAKPNVFSADFNANGYADAVVLYGTGQTCPASNPQSVNYGTDHLNPTFVPSDIEMNYGVDEGGANCNGKTTFYAVGTELLDVDGDGFTDVLEQQRSATNHWILLHNNNSGSVVRSANIDFGDGDISRILTGDFNGDGLSDLYGQHTQTIQQSLGNGTFSPIDISSMGIDTSTNTKLFAADFDGDGCTDILANGSQSEIFFMCSPAPPATVQNWVHNGWDITIADFNGDGKADVLVIPDSGTGTGGQLWLSTGTGLVEVNSNVQLGSGNWGNWSDYFIVTGDWNGDGKADIAVIPKKATGKYWYVYYSTGAGTFVASGVGKQINGSSNTVTATAADWNNDGGPDIWLQFSGSEQDRMERFPFIPITVSQVTNGIGVTTGAGYRPLSDSTVYQKGTGAVFPIQDVVNPLWVVAATSSSNGLLNNSCPGSCTLSSSYFYTGGKMDAGGRGFLGFQSVAIIDPRGLIHTSNYCVKFPCTGLVTSQTKVCPVGTFACSASETLNTTTNTYADITLPSGTDGVARHYNELTRTVAASADTDGTAYPGVVTNYTNFDDYYNPQTITILTYPTDGGGADVVRTTTNTFTNTASTTQWFIGRLATAQVKTFASATARGGATNAEVTRQSQYSYDPTSGLLTEEVIEPNDTTGLMVTTDYQYDSLGNKHVATLTGSGTSPPAPRITTTTFDPASYNGEFPTEIDNALSQSEHWQYDTRFGTPTNHIGPNGLSPTKWTYDAFGRLATETQPDGTVRTYKYAYCNGVFGGTDTTCPGATDVSGCQNIGAYLITATTTTGDLKEQTAPTTRTYYDILSRVVAKDIQGFDGSSWSRTCSVYSWFGNLAYTTRPYFYATEYGKFTRYDYDGVGRVTLITAQDGTKTSYAYSGQKTTVVKDVGGANETTVTTQNDMGLTGSVTDANTKITQYTYGAEGTLNAITDPYGNVSSATYDIRGRLKTSADNDRGSWSYVHDSFNQLTQETDANGNPISFTYDKLGRLTNKTAPDIVSTWQYDAAANGIGQIAVEQCQGGVSGDVCHDAPGSTGPSPYTRTFTYDSLGRPDTQTDAWGTNSYYSETGYDAYTGRASTERSFSGFTTKKIYNAAGYICQIVDSTSTNTDCTGTNKVYWQANQRDSEMHLLSQSSGNGTGLAISQSYYPLTGRLETICAAPTGASCTDTNATYTWDNIGNLSQRQDSLAGLTEHFCYDGLNRLINYATGSAITCPNTTGISVGYDALGNITAKSDVGTYAYPQTGGVTTSHQLASIDTTTGCTVNPPCYVNGTTNPSFSYDQNGNMTSGAGRTIQNTAENLTSSITQASNTWAYKYDPDGNRALQTFGNAVTTYLNNPAAGVMSELWGHTGTGVPIWHDYMIADGNIVAERLASTAGGLVTFHYFVRDNLSSAVTVTDSTGAVLSNGQMSYDAWGKQRNTNWSPDTNCSLPPASPTTRGFAGQEEISGLCPLVNMNARMYDSQIGRFLSADPLIGDDYDGQALNRYSYVENNPLTLTDPSGRCFLGCFWHSSTFSAVASLAVAITGQEWALPALETQLGLQATAALSTINAGISGGVSGYVGSGKLQGAELGAGEALAFAGVHFVKADLGIPTDTAQGAAESAGMHGLVGGFFSVASRGKFSSGFLAAGIGDLAGNGDLDQANAMDLVKHSLAGGLGSILGGGKFANGAETGAFGYLFNDAMQEWATAGTAIGAVGGAGLGGAAAVAGESACVSVTAGGCAVLAPAAPGAIAGGMATGGVVGGYIGNTVGGFLGSVYDLLQGISYAVKAPGVPTPDNTGGIYQPPKNWNGEKVPSPNGGGYGYPDADGNVWIPTGEGGAAHGGPHWDVQKPGGGYVNVYPGGTTR